MSESNTLYNKFNNAIDTDSKSFNIITYEHHEIHEGVSWYTKSWVDVDGADSQYNLLITVGATPPHLVWNVYVESEFLFSLYEDVVTSDDGTLITTYNRNRNSTIPPVTTWYHTPTITTPGSCIWCKRVGSGKDSFGTRTGVGEFLFKKNTKYNIKFTKKVAGTHYIDYSYGWYENGT